MKGPTGPEAIAYGDLLASVEAQIPAPHGAAWRKRNWRSHIGRKNGLTHTEQAAVANHPVASESKPIQQIASSDTAKAEGAKKEDFSKDAPPPEAPTE